MQTQRTIKTTSLPKRAPLLPDRPHSRLPFPPPILDSLHLRLLPSRKHPPQTPRQRSHLRHETRRTLKHLGKLGTAVHIRIGPSECPQFLNVLSRQTCRRRAVRGRPEQRGKRIARGRCCWAQQRRCRVERRRQGRRGGRRWSVDEREFSALERGDDRVGVVAERVREARGGLFWSSRRVRSASQCEREPGLEHGWWRSQSVEKSHGTALTRQTAPHIFSVLPLLVTEENTSQFQWINGNQLTNPQPFCCTQQY